MGGCWAEGGGSGEAGVRASEGRQARPINVRGEFCKQAWAAGGEVWRQPLWWLCDCASDGEGDASHGTWSTSKDLQRHADAVDSASMISAASVN